MRLSSWICHRWLAGCGLGLGLACSPVWSQVDAAVRSPVQLHCDVTYAGATVRVTALPVQDVYAVPALDIRNRFRFKAVVVGEGAEIGRVNLYVYQHTERQPVLVQQARYLPPFAWPADGAALALTGQQHVYAGPMERELIYSCALHRGSP